MVDRTEFEFGAGELRYFGGDYGSITLEGATPEARIALDAITARARSGCGGLRIDLFVVIDDPAPPVVEDRHAGYAGTEGAGVGPGVGNAYGSGSEEGLAEDSAGEGQAAGGEGS